MTHRLASPSALRPPTRWTLILRARRMRRLQAELSSAAAKAQLTAAEINIIETASKALYHVEFILSVSARRASPSRRASPRLVQTNNNRPTEQQS